MPNGKLADISEYLQSHKSSFENDLCELLRIPSVSADSTHRGDIRRAAEWMADHFRRLDFETELIETSGCPLIYAAAPHVAGAPTALVYGHYDVQPPDPVDLWTSPPFEPTVRDGNVYARGATDDKGQMLTHVKSAQAWIETRGSLPINVKYIIEGEEEIGSVCLEEYLAENASRLACDCVVISDTSQFAPDQPAITYGLRGIAYYELSLVGPKRDLHSGSFGGAVTNPANALAGLLGEMIDEDGKIQLPGFYDDVVPLTTREREGFQALSFSDQRFLEMVGVAKTTGEAGFSSLERRWARPCLDVNGLCSGYQGEGAKTVLPAKASAKFSFRLVPDQKPENVSAGLKAFLEERCPPGITYELQEFHGSTGLLVPLDSPYVKAAARAIENGFDRSPVFIREGGSIPIVTEFADKLSNNILLLGWGQNDDNTHSPNEKFCLADYHRGIKSSAHLWAELAKLEG